MDPQLHTAASKLFGQAAERVIDELAGSIENVTIRRGDFLFRDGDPSDGVYALVSGRMQVIEERKGQRVVIGEAHPGETIGEMAFFTNDPRSASVLAARDTQLIKFPNDTFDRIISSHPDVVRELMRVQITRLRRTTAGDLVTPAAIDLAVVAADDDVPLREFSERLAQATAALGTTMRLDSSEVDRLLDTPGIASVTEHDPENARLVGWLNEQETRYRYVIYESERGATEWNARAIRQADRVLVVANAKSKPRYHEPPADGTPRTLVLLHADGKCLPQGTADWVKTSGIDDHHHIRTDSDADFARLARILGGHALGLVLGGGGARGFAHIGVLRALRDAGITIDMTGGTSMGAAIAAQYAMGWSPEEILERNREVWVKVRPQNQYTLPVVSLLGSAATERCGRMLYGDTQIEDLWLRFFCISSDLSTATAVIHRSGALLKATTASASVPGVTAPVFDNGRLLVDGAFLNNVPADVMRQLGAGRVVASEVAVEEDAAFTCSDNVPTWMEWLKGWWRGKKFPSILELLLRASMLASIRRENDALRMADYVFHPPINAFGLLDFDSIENIEKTGYEHAREELEKGALKAG